MAHVLAMELLIGQLLRLVGDFAAVTSRGNVPHLQYSPLPKAGLQSMLRDSGELVMKISLARLVENPISSGLLSAEEASTFCRGLTTCNGVAESDTVIQEVSAAGKDRPPVWSSVSTWCSTRSALAAWETVIVRQEEGSR
jgi:hypothetical protein